ncbi:hypothetical protein Tco_0933565 [Tanacetum coccineum]
MHDDNNLELAKNHNNRIPQIMNEMFERVRVFIRGEVTEILAMESVNFPPLPPLIGTLEKQNLNKFCNYHRDKGHNTNDYYHLKKQIEEAVASGKLAHLVKDIRQGGNRRRPYEMAEPRVMEEIVFSAISGDNLTDTSIILEATIEGFRGNLPLSGAGRPLSDHGGTREKKDLPIGICYCKASLPLQLHLKEDGDEKSWSSGINHTLND